MARTKLVMALALTIALVGAGSGGRLRTSRMETASPTPSTSLRR